MSIDFLSHILPNSPYYCATIIENKRSKNRFFKSIEKLNTFICSYEGDGAVYHACAGYETNENRKQENVSLLQAFWADVDIRDEKGYQSEEEAIEALKVYLKKIKLPWPTVVYSGGGFHLYWPLKEPIEEPIWKKYAEGLKRSFKRFGFKVDPTRTSDAASILRTPGTVNNKHGKEVELLHLSEKYDLKVFELLLLQPKDTEQEKKVWDLVDPTKLFVGCAQLAHFKSGGDQTEPEWKNCARILAHCKDGNSLWHRYSKADERYNYEEAERKWQESVAFGKPVTCNEFKSCSPDRCDGCPNKEKTPIGLVKQYIPTSINEGWKEILDVALPEQYKIGSYGQILLVRGGDKEGDGPKTEVVHKDPFYIRGRCVNELGEGGQTIIVRHFERLEGWKTFEIPSDNIYDRIASKCAGQGLVVTNPVALQNYLVASFNKMKDENKTAKVYETFGWKDNHTKFLYGNQLYSWDNETNQLKLETVAISGDAKSVAPYMRPGGVNETGRMEGWIEALSHFYGKGREWQLATVISAAASVLHPLIDPQEAGIALSLHAMSGGEGKTTATVAAQSVFSDFAIANCGPTDSMVVRCAKIGTFANLPVAFDEMVRDDPGVAFDFMRQFTSGREKERAGRDGKKTRTPRTWQTTLITNANSELIGSILANGRSNAMADRIIEIEASKLPISKKDYSINIRKMFEINCGYAGAYIIGLILQDLDYYKDVAPKMATMYFKKFGNDPKMRYKARFMAGFHIMAALLESSGIMNAKHENIVEYMFNAVQGSKEEFVPPKPLESYLSEYIREHANCILYTKSWKGPKAPIDALAEIKGPKVKIRVESDANTIYIPQADMQAWLQKNSDVAYRSFIKHLEGQNILIARNRMKNLGAATRYSIPGEYCLVIDKSHSFFEDMYEIEVEEPHDERPKVIPIRRLKQSR